MRVKHLDQVEIYTDGSDTYFLDPTSDDKFHQDIRKNFKTSIISNSFENLKIESLKYAQLKDVNNHILTTDLYEIEHALESGYSGYFSTTFEVFRINSKFELICKDSPTYNKYLSKTKINTISNNQQIPNQIYTTDSGADFYYFGYLDTIIFDTCNYEYSKGQLNMPTYRIEKRHIYLQLTKYNKNYLQLGKVHNMIQKFMSLTDKRKGYNLPSVPLHDLIATKNKKRFTAISSDATKIDISKYTTASFTSSFLSQLTRKLAYYHYTNNSFTTTFYLPIDTATYLQTLSTHSNLYSHFLTIK